MKNLSIIFVILMMIMTNVFVAQVSSCNLNLPENMPNKVFVSGISYVDLDVRDRNVYLEGDSYGVTFYGNTKFTNCRIYINRHFRYSDKKYEFYNCEIYFASPYSFRGMSLIFGPTNSEIIFDGNCIIGQDLSEPFHVEDSSFRFINNWVDISAIGHMFHFVNLKPNGDNAFYGNIIVYSGGQGVIKVDKSSQTEIKIGDNSQAKNIIYSNVLCISEYGASKVPIRIENTEFNGNSIIVLSNNTKLTIDNCKFKSFTSNNTYGNFGIWFNNSTASTGNDDLICKNSIFQGYNQAIISYRGNLIVENCTFLENNYAVKVSKSSTNGNGEIKSNTFTSNNIDVFATGSFNELEVSGNNFSGREFGFLADGHNNYELKNNSFYNSYAGSIAYANGANNNLVEGNQYYTLIGTHALEDNSSYQFTDNCFSTAGGDVYLDGTVASAVGSDGAEANNCFTKGGIPDISAATNAFEYYRSDNSPICEDPTTPGSYVEFDAVSKKESNCGSGTPFSSTVRKYCSISFKYTTCKQAKLMLLQIDKDIADVTKSTSYRAKVKDNILKALKNCRLKILVFLKTCIDPKPEDPRFPDGEISSASWTGNEPNIASSVLMTSSDKYERAAYVNTMISMGNFAEINAYLQSYSSEDEEEADYVEVQKINVARFLSQTEHIASQDDLNILQLAANKPYPLAAYARGLYTQLTGDIIMPPIPRITFNRSVVQHSSHFGLMPNPVTDQLQVSLPSNQSSEIRITDITGKTYYQNNMLESMVDINTTTWPSGVYFVVCTNEQGIGECKKLIKQ